MNGDGHQHSGTSAQYMINSTSPLQQHSRTASGPMTGSNGHLSYGNNIASSHAHPSSRQGSLALSPKQEYNLAMNNQRLSGANISDTPSAAQSATPSSQEVMKLKALFQSNVLTPPQQKPVRAKDPMSFASILSEPAVHLTPSQNNITLPAKSSQMAATESTSIKVHEVKLETEQASPAAVSSPPVAPKPMLDRKETSITEPVSKPVVKPRKALTAKEYESISRAMEAIDSQPLTDVEESDFAAEKERYAQKGRKRALELEEAEVVKRKVRALFDDHQYPLTVEI